jgi:hypothetical protein
LLLPPARTLVLRLPPQLLDGALLLGLKLLDLLLQMSFPLADTGQLLGSAPLAFGHFGKVTVQLLLGALLLG